MSSKRPYDKTEVLDADEASAWLKIPKSTLYKLCTEGEIPAAKVGRHWRFHCGNLEDWFLSRTRLNTPQELPDEIPKEDKGHGTTD